MTFLPTTSELAALIDQQITKRLLPSLGLIAKVTGITPGTGIQLQFAEDSAPANTLYNVINTYDSTKPAIGDQVLCDSHPVGGSGSSVTILGKIVAPAGPTGLTVPVGAVMQYAGSSAPAGWLICDGSAVSRTTYVDLFNAIGTTYGVGDGSTTFNIPNCNGSAAIGTGRAPTGSTTRVLGQSGGEESHALSVGELASHTHTGPSHTHTVQISGSSGVQSGASFFSPVTAGGATGADGTEATGSAGSGTAHNNMSPFLVLNFIIRT